MRRATWVGASGAMAALLAAGACGEDGGAADSGVPAGEACSPGGRGGAAGLGGAAGVGGAGGGAPQMGSGGGGSGGTGGAPPCADTDAGDAACASGKGGGSLCVGGACTEAKNDCSTKALVVVEHGRTVDDAQLAGACHFRDLNGARAAVTNATARLALYVDEASSSGVLSFTAAATLDGHAADAAKAVTLTLPQAADVPLVAFAQGGALRGVALNGGGAAPAVRVAAGALTVAGPTTLTNASPALELVGSASAAVTGTAAAPVTFTANARGVVVAPAASLTMTGEGGASLVVEKTSGGAGVLAEAGGSSAAVTLEKVTFSGNLFSGSTGTGAVEVRQGRQVAVRNGVFANNRQSVTLNGGGDSGIGAFLNVIVEGNDFTAALPAANGSVVCGENLGAGDTTLNLGANTFASGKACDVLEGEQRDSCNTAGEIGYSAAGRDFDLVCGGG